MEWYNNKTLKKPTLQNPNLHTTCDVLSSSLLESLQVKERRQTTKQSVTWATPKTTKYTSRQRGKTTSRWDVTPCSLVVATSDVYDESAASMWKESTLGRSLLSLPCGAPA